ncbi:hypothetical protein SAMN05216350_106192 [Polaromonas sp. YR568]|uniref:hypothetical protein n=1 Tax=Polaromonas sp. YR568 TaxID=1855301 RepID=UPI0008E0E360|nr:hypothetical protein [Polaromonas sp. YR568]SFU85215.1 hypothetical protein SAMN05216350_106192 [Polaromonas sp. YR568]
MRFKGHLRFAITALFLAGSAGAFAQDKACLMEGSFSIAGQKTEIKDCLQNGGVPTAQFKETCTGLAQTAAAMGGPPAKVTYMGACPAQAQGSCEGFFGKPMTSYYYKREPQTLGQVKSSCIAQGGKWK